MAKLAARAEMPTSAAGNDRRLTTRLGPSQTWLAKGFTLIELLVVLVLVALGASLVVLSMRDGPQQQLQQEADRLASYLESAKAQARTSHTPLLWRSDETGFSLSPLADVSKPLSRQTWLFPNTRSEPREWLISPEPVQAPMQLQLLQTTGGKLGLQSDGVTAFKVQS